MNDQKFFDLCAKRLSDTISSEEEAELTNYLADHPGQDETYQELKHRWNLSEQLQLKYKSDPDAAWEKFSQLRSEEQPKTVRWIHFAYRLAAMVVLTIGLGFLFREFGKTEAYHYATFDDETKWVILPDSSRVRLNESSLLTVSASFNEEERNVELKGEAFFEITRDEKRPFIIQADDATTRVLGTSFNIRAVEDDPMVEIFVVSGRVSFSAGDAELILTRNMAANFNSTDNLLELDPQESNALAWMSKTLKFDDTSLDQVFADLQAYFDVDIKVTNDNIKNCRFTGEFNKPNLEEILKIISISADISYTKNSNGYTIQGEGCPLKN